MKKKLIKYGCFALFVILFFFPIPTTHSVSGEGQVQTDAGDILGDCELSIGIKEVKSLVFCYKKTFSLVLDEQQIFSELLATSYSETCVTWWISGMYYDAEENQCVSCDLHYQEDLSHFEIDLKGKTYILEAAA